MRHLQAENRAAEFERQTNKMQKENENLEGKSRVGVCLGVNGYDSSPLFSTRTVLHLDCLHNPPFPTLLFDLLQPAFVGLSAWIEKRSFPVYFSSLLRAIITFPSCSPP